MIDLVVKCGASAVIAWLATRRITPSNAAWAHRLWLVVALSPLAWLAGEGSLRRSHTPGCGRGRLSTR